MNKIYFFLSFIFSQLIYSQSNYCISDISFDYTTISIHTTNGNVYTWGQNHYGHVGNGNTQTQDSPWLRPSAPSFTSISHSANHSTALTNDGKIYAWGRNFSGEVGNGSTTAVYTPVQIGTDSDWKAVKSGLAHTLALKTNGTLWGWGNNNACELSQTAANPSPNNFYTQPIQISSDNDWKDIAAGSNRTFAIKNNGTLWTRGKNTKYSIGIPNIGEGACVSALTQVGSSSDWKKVYTSASGNFTLALKTNNTLWGWGDNVDGATGTGQGALIVPPIQVGTGTWKDVAAGHNYAAGIRSDGTLWGWGKSCAVPSSGTLVPVSSLAPIQMSTETDWVKVVAGNCAVFALKSNNTVWAWGAYGALWNNGTDAHSSTPIIVFQCNLSTSENDRDFSNIVLYPNPTVDKISWALNISIEKITIYDMSWRKILSENNPENSVDVSDLPNGTYMIKLESKDKSIYNSRFIKK